MKKLYITITCILIVLTLINVYISTKPQTDNDKEKINIVNKNYSYKERFNEKKVYYNKTNYKTINKIFNEKKVYTIAITNNKSNTRDIFIKLINKISFYNNENIYLINISDLSKKNKAKYYNLNKELKNLKEDCIIKIYNKKIIAKTTFTKNNINKIIDSYK
jgi:hypothetical protein